MGSEMKRQVLLDNLRRCARCGKCRSVCPLLPVDGRESSVARGKIEVIRRVENDGVEFPGKELLKFLDNCLLCGRCELICPNKVRTVEIFSSARADIASREGMSFGKKAFLAATSFPAGVISVASTLWDIAGKRLLKKIPSESGIFYRLPSFLSGEGRIVPGLAGHPYIERHGISSAEARTKSFVLFTGCVFNYVYPEVLENTPLSRLGVNPPEGQVCCGLPAYASGDQDRAFKLGVKNIELFDDLDAKVVVPCASCLYMLKEIYPRAFEGTEWEEKARRLSDSCLTLEEFIRESSARTAPESSLREDVKIGFHVPCHLRPYPDVVEGIREILGDVLGDRFVHMEGADLCCGFGGTFNITNYAKSMKMGEGKIELAHQSGVDIILSSCSGCIHHLREAAANAGSPVKVLHVGEVLRVSPVDI